MKIALFDVDDTITYETEFLLKNAPEFLEIHNLQDVIVNSNGYNLGEIFDIKQQLKNKGLTSQEAEIQEKKLIDAFWNKYFVKYNTQKFRPNVKEIIDLLKENNYQIHFLSMRGKKTKDNSWKNEFIRTKVVPFITKIALRKNKISFDKITLVSTEQEKLEYIKFYNPVLIFEDQPKILENISSEKAVKICISTPHNENFEFVDAYRINDYEECIPILKEVFLKEKKLKKVKKSNEFKITDFWQKTLKLIGGWYFIYKYKPIVLGKENIPKKGGIAFVCNHRNKLDPVLISITSKKSIHWAALLRMFQGKEDLFSLKKNKFICILSAKFISMMGALPIARTSDKNFGKINAETIDKLTFALDCKCSIGWFPEGTINRKTECVNILPLKSDLIFRMASKTDSYIQPVSIVWLQNEPLIKNKLVIIYSYPINTYNRNKKEINDIWEETVNRNIDLAKEIIKNYKKC